MCAGDPSVFRGHSDLQFNVAKTALNNIQKLKAKTDAVVRDMQKVRSHLIIPSALCR